MNGSGLLPSYEDNFPFIVYENLVIQYFEDVVSLNTLSFAGAIQEIIVAHTDTIGENTTSNVLEFSKAEGA